METKVKGYRVRVTRADCRTGEPGECFRCAVALALQRATGDSEAHVYESGWDGRMMLEVHARHIPAPISVRNFIWEFDDLLLRPDGRAIGADELRRPVFTLPPLSDSEWQEECGCCQELLPPADLDDEGTCPDCRDRP